MTPSSIVEEVLARIAPSSEDGVWITRVLERALRAAAAALERRVATTGSDLGEWGGAGLPLARLRGDFRPQRGGWRRGAKCRRADQLVELKRAGLDGILGFDPYSRPTPPNFALPQQIPARFAFGIVRPEDLEFFELCAAAAARLASTGSPMALPERRESGSARKRFDPKP